MVRKLKTYQTSLGFYDLAIAAPSMKAALEAWGAGSNLFHQGVARESGDPDVVAATVSKPGVVLRRPVGSNGPFREHADLPTHLAGDGPSTVQTRQLRNRRSRPRERPTTRQPARPRLPSRGNNDGVKASAGRKRPPPRSSANDASRQSIKPKQRWKGVNASIIRGWRQSRPSATLSKRNRKRRTPVGRRRRRNWRGLCGARESRASTRAPAAAGLYGVAVIFGTIPTQSIICCQASTSPRSVVAIRQ